MLRDYLQIEESDRLVEQSVVRLNNRGQQDITKWFVVGRDGQHKGSIALFDRMNMNRSYCVNYRITQRDVNGRVVVDHLTDEL